MSAVGQVNRGIKMSRGYKDLIAWQRAMDLARRIYELTASFPLSERYCLSDQLKRAAVSSPSVVRLK